MRILTIEEKMKIVAGLQYKRKEILEKMNKLPFLKSSLGVIEAEKKLEEEICEVENAIQMFSRREKKVILTDSNTF